MNLKTRKEIKSLKKVLVVGYDATGKSTFAEKYCKENNLNPVVIDIEDSNFTSLPLINDLDISNDRKAIKNMELTIMEIKDAGYDTVIVDGLDTYIEALISKAQGLKAYSDRSKNFAKFVTILRKSGLNFILIGQIVCDLGFYEGTTENPNKCIIRANSLVNERYRCTYVNGKYEVETTKYRR